MADKLGSGISVNVDFVEGESPSPAKLTAITVQTRRAATQLEEAVGDIHSESWPYTSASPTTLSQGWNRNPDSGVALSGAPERKLDIANLARLIGPASNLNPKTVNGAKVIIEVTPVDVHEFSLKYPVSGDVTLVITTDPSMTTQRVSPAGLTNAGDWHVNSGGKVRSVTATTGGTITYTTDPAEYNGGMAYSRASFNVIPDPNQIANGLGVAIGALDGFGQRPVTLPLATFQQSNTDLDSVVLDGDDVNYNQLLLLPAVLVDNLTVGDEIPAGFMYLKNETTGEVYEDGVCYYNSSTSIKIGNVDLTSAISAGNKFSLITVGTDITSSIDDLRNKHYHTHDRSHGEPYVHVRNLIGQNELAGDSGVFVPSNIPGNHFSQYLHRDGYSGSNDQNANDGNAMRGALVMGRVAGAPGTYAGLPGESFRVSFGGRGTEYPHIKRDSNDDMEINAGTTNHLILQAGGGSSKTYSRGGPIVPETGIQSPYGDIIAIPYFGSGLHTTSADRADWSVLSAAIPASVRGLQWLSVDLTFSITDVFGQYWGPNYPSEVISIAQPIVPKWFMTWYAAAGLMQLLVRHPGNAFNTNAGYYWKIMIWHKTTSALSA